MAQKSFGFCSWSCVEYYRIPDDKLIALRLLKPPTMKEDKSFPPWWRPTDSMAAYLLHRSHLLFLPLASLKSNLLLTSKVYFHVYHQIHRDKLRKDPSNANSFLSLSHRYPSSLCFLSAFKLEAFDCGIYSSYASSMQSIELIISKRCPLDAKSTVYSLISLKSGTHYFSSYITYNR